MTRVRDTRFRPLAGERAPWGGRRRASRLLLLSLLGPLVAAGCSVQQLATRATAGLLIDGQAALNAETDLELAAASAAASLTLVEGVLRRSPDRVDLRLVAAQGYVGYALAFVERTDPERAVDLYRRGRGHALHAWRVQARRARLPAPEQSLWFDLDALESYLAALGTSYVPVVYWTAQGWGGMINNRRHDPELLADLPTIMALARFVVRHDPGYGFAGAHTLLGGLSASVPRGMGGVPDAGRDHFERALALTEGRFLMNHVLYAATYAVQVQDRALFDALLATVRGADPDLLPEQRLANAVARRRAQELGAAAAELFE